MATSIIPNPQKVDYATPTRTEGSIWTSGTISLRKCNGIVQIKLDGAVFSAVSQRTTFATIPEEYRPLTESYFKDESGYSLLIDASGNFKTGQRAAGTVWGTGMYIAG